MGFYSGHISNLMGRTIVGIDVDEGRVFFDVEDPVGGDDLEYTIKPDFNWGDQDFIVDIEGDLADLIDTSVLFATYDPYLMRYVVQTALGTVSFNADGPDTSFEAL